MTIRYNLTPVDFAAAALLYLFRTRGGIALVAGFVLLTLPPTLSALPDGFPIVVDVITVAVIEALLVVVVVLITLVLSVLMSMGRNTGVFTEHSIRLDERGLYEETSVNKTEHVWKGVRAIVRSRNHIVLVVGPGMLHAIPRRAVDSHDEWIRLGEQIISAWRLARA